MRAPAPPEATISCHTYIHQSMQEMHGDASKSSPRTLSVCPRARQIVPDEDAHRAKEQNKFLLQLAAKGGHQEFVTLGYSRKSFFTKWPRAAMGATTPALAPRGAKVMLQWHGLHPLFDAPSEARRLETGPAACCT